MYGPITLAATLLVAAVSAIIVAVAPRLEQRDSRRAAYGGANDRDRADDDPVARP